MNRNTQADEIVKAQFHPADINQMHLKVILFKACFSLFHLPQELQNELCCCLLCFLSFPPHVPSGFSPAACCAYQPQHSLVCL